MGRRWGKSTMGGAISLAAAAAGGRVAWVVPNYSNGRPLWRWAANAVAGLEQLRRCAVNKTERAIEFDSGGGLGIFTADHPDSMRGEAFHVVVVDEAARIAEDVIEDVIVPTLADYAGDLILISSPKGLNWFWRRWAQARDAMNSLEAAWTAPTRANPSPQIQAAYAAVQARTAAGQYPLRSLQQEWEAQFVADGAYFQNVDACCILEHPDRPSDHAGHTFGMGLDWGKSEDFTSGTIGCRECDRVVDWFRFNTVDYRVQRGRIVEYVRKWPGIRVLPERNSIGTPNIEELRAASWKDAAGLDQYIDIALGPDLQHGFNTSPQTKPIVIEMLYLALQRGKKFPREYAEEFRAYEVMTRENGRPSFSAPEGQHDDRVISAALENWLAASALQVF